ncbi:hypothetical protein ACLHDF_19170 [Priestia aryabhattai]|uniref:hypothetical protein n=1 Tax=Priestia megaterium TaxID=1404 RepID=UPI0039B8582F
MKLSFVCMDCVRENDLNNHNFIELDIQDGGIYRSVCSKGHKVTNTLQNEQFEVLFEMGALALLDGYSRESVSSFASALERFYEYSIKVLLLQKGINYEEIKKTWKMVARQSERQLGAFYFLYLNEFKEVPPKLPDKCTTFRNDVIHKGYIPKRQEVISYATEVYNYINLISKTLRSECREHIMTPFSYRQKELMEKEVIGTLQSQVVPTMIDMALDDELFGKEPFEQALEDLKRRIGLGFVR